jgi:hypothetical protein
MAKSQLKGNREAKKPKQAKKPPAGVASSFTSQAKAVVSIPPGKK